MPRTKEERAGTLRSLRRTSTLLGVCAMAAWSAEAPCKELASCASAYEQSQVDRMEGRLRDSLEQLHECVRAECSEFVRGECGRWLAEVESSLPSVVLVAKRGHREVAEVQVFLDGELLVQRLDGKALSVDPGQHEFRFESQQADPKVVDVLIREGEKNRAIRVDFEEAGPPKHEPGRAPPEASQETRPPPSGKGPLPYVLLGVGAAGVAGFAVLGLTGNQGFSEKQRTCAPSCTDDEVGSVRTRYALADVSLGIGLVALAVGGYLFFTESGSTSEPRTASGFVNVDIAVTPRGGGGRIRARF